MVTDKEYLKDIFKNHACWVIAKNIVRGKNRCTYDPVCNIDCLSHDDLIKTSTLLRVPHSIKEYSQNGGYKLRRITITGNYNLMELFNDVPIDRNERFDIVKSYVELRVEKYTRSKKPRYTMQEINLFNQLRDIEKIKRAINRKDQKKIEKSFITKRVEK